MTLEMLQQVLGWCAIFNMAVILIWFLIFLFGKRWLMLIDRKFLDISEEKIQFIHYSAMAFYKIMNLLFFLGPYLAIEFFKK